MAVKPDIQWKPPVRYLTFAILFVFLMLLLWFIRHVLEPLVIAAFVAYLIHPGVNYLTGRTRLSRPAAVNLVYFVALAILVGLPAVVTPLFFDEFQQVISDMLNIFNQLIASLTKPYTLFGFPVDLSQYANQLTQFRSTLLASLPAQALVLLGKTSLGFLWVLVILVAVYYFLAEWPNMRGKFIGSFPEPYQPELAELYQRLRRIWMGYLRGQLTLMLIVGVVFTIAWTVVGLPGALVLGLIAGFLTIVPDVGPFIAAALAVFVALLEGSNWWPFLPHLVVALIVAAVYGILISIKNFWLRPFIVGRSVHMNEALVFISIIMATVIWGLLGALLVVPILASTVVIVDYLRRRILGMPPFPPSEPFVPAEEPAAPAGKEKAPRSTSSRKKKK